MAFPSISSNKHQWSWVMLSFVSHVLNEPLKDKIPLHTPMYKHLLRKRKNAKRKVSKSKNHFNSNIFAASRINDHDLELGAWNSIITRAIPNHWIIKERVVSCQIIWNLCKFNFLDTCIILIFSSLHEMYLSLEWMLSWHVTL